jgi:hypothetical protein
MILPCIFKHIYLRHFFQQTVGYFFSPSSMPADDIATVIKDAIRHLHHIGLTVCSAKSCIIIYFLNSSINNEQMNINSNLVLTTMY